MKRLLTALTFALCATVASAQLKVHVGHTGSDTTGAVVAGLVSGQMAQLGAKIVSDDDSEFSVYLVTIGTDRGSAISASFVTGVRYLRSSITTCPAAAVFECAKSIVGDAVRTMKQYADSVEKPAATGRSL